MLTLFNWLDRWTLTSRTKVKQAWRRRQARRSPDHFRHEIRIDPDRAEPFASLLEPWQERDFQALDAAARSLAGHQIPEPRFRAWIERPRGHSKTSDMAVEIAWMLLASARPLDGIAVAADRDQASLIADALRRLARLNPDLCEPLAFQKHLVANTATAARLQILSSDVGSSWGLLPDFVICDELCHWEQPDLWFSLLSSAAKKPRCLLAVLTNAGVGRDWHWEAREAARTNPAWHFSSLDGPQAPWITADILREQRLLLPKPVYERLWLNRWQHSDGEFVTLAEAEACRDESLAPQSLGQPGTHYIAAIDYAEKHDHTVAVLLHRERSRDGGGMRVQGPGARDGKESSTPSLSDPQRSPFDAHRASVARPSSLNPHPSLIVDRLDLVVPAPDRPTPVAWVEDWIRRIAADFHHVTFVLDEYQLVGTIQRLQHEFDVRRFPFRAGKGNHALALNLRSLILRRAIRWYPDCGAACGVASPHPSPPLRGRQAGGEGVFIDSTHTKSFSSPTPDLDPSDQSTPNAPHDPHPSLAVSHSSNPQSEIPNPQSKDTLETELASLLFRQSPSGLCRIDHKPGHHDDRAFALGAAALVAIENPAPDATLDITPPTPEGDFRFF